MPGNERKYQNKLRLSELRYFFWTTKQPSSKTVSVLRLGRTHGFVISFREAESISKRENAASPGTRPAEEAPKTGGRHPLRSKETEH